MTDYKNSVNDLECIGETLRFRLATKVCGHTREEFVEWSGSVAGVWWQYVDGVGELTAAKIESEFGLREHA